MNKHFLLSVLLGLGALTSCATVGTGLEIAGGLIGQKTLASAGKSVARVSEVENFGPEEKYYTGRTVAAQLLQGEKVSTDISLEAYVGRVGNCVALASGMAELPHGWHFILLQETEPNAYACPGGLIFVSQGLVKLCQSEDELAGALAHEISHIALDHPITAISAANKKAALMSLAEFGLAEATKGKDLQDLTQSFDSVVKEVGQAVSHGYDRGKEAEADQAAVGMLVELGYDPRGLKRVLERLKAGDKSHGDPQVRARAVGTAAYALEPVPAVLPERTARFKAAL